MSQLAVDTPTCDLEMAWNQQPGHKVGILKINLSWKIECLPGVLEGKGDTGFHIMGMNQGYSLVL